MFSLDFNKQYNQSYIARFNYFKELILRNSTYSEYFLPLKTLSDDLDNKCIVIAILFLDTKAKASILRENDKNEPNYLKNYHFYIEDSKNRVILSFTDEFNKLSVYTSGMILGFVGYKNNTNVFVCSDVIFPEPLIGKINTEKRVPVELECKNKRNNALFVSNIKINENFDKIKMAFDYCRDFVQEVVVFGNIFRCDTELPILSDFEQIFDIENNNITVRIIPNTNDYFSDILPAEPLHKKLFNNAIIQKLDLLAHPGKYKSAGMDFVCINRFIIDDLMKYSKNDCTVVKAMKQLLDTRYLAPNSPDTIASVPMLCDDPLYINNCDYFIVGGTDKYTNTNYNGIEMLTIPDFCKTKSVVILDKTTHSSTEIFFDFPV